MNPLRAVFLVLPVLVLSFCGAGALDFPTRPITIVVPFPAGGPGDTIARAMRADIQRSLGQPILIENITGAAGSIGTRHVARATPDGHTLILGYW